MVVGLTDQMIVSPMDLAFSKYIVKGACNGTVEDLKECIAFSAENSITCPVRFIKFDELPHALRKMHDGEIKGRLCVEF